ncbi:MAG: HlyD family efflux transporter periplasmic adaptor subunit [Spirochaetaceae bacterium]|nr:HlyD family efflux transporter periplasmic adaptor subunit [Spirochaetaceae bacterium]
MEKKRKKRSFFKAFFIIIFILALIGGGLFAARKFFAEKKTEKTIYVVSKEVYENVIEVSGTVAAAKEQKLQALSSGTVTAVYVKAGDKVKTGDVILQLDDTDQVYNLAKHDFSMATTRISGAARELKLMETERLALLRKVSDRKVTATFDGVIAALDVAVGDSLEAKDNVGTLVNTDYLTAEVEVAETDVPKLVVGQPVDFTFSVYKDKTVKGYVVSWPAIGEVTSRGATVVKAKIRIDEYPPEILPNFSFTGKIQISPPEENIIVSRYAVGYDNGAAFVVLAKTNEKRAVTVKNYGKDYVKILSGLEGGEALIAQSEPLVSGWNRNRGGMPGGAMPGMGGMSGGKMPGSGSGGSSKGSGGAPGGMPGMGGR